MLASASMDRSVFVWSLTSDRIREQIDLAENPIHEQKRRLIKAYPVAFADIEAKAKTLHSHYVDNVQWYGDMLISRVSYFLFDLIFLYEFFSRLIILFVYGNQFLVIQQKHHHLNYFLNGSCMKKNIFGFLNLIFVVLVK
jgi:hypothetical protein